MLTPVKTMTDTSSCDRRDIVVTRAETTRLDVRTIVNATLEGVRSAIPEAFPCSRPRPAVKHVPGPVPPPETWRRPPYPENARFCDENEYRRWCAQMDREEEEDRKFKEHQLWLDWVEYHRTDQGLSDDDDDDDDRDYADF